MTKKGACTARLKTCPFKTSRVNTRIVRVRKLASCTESRYGRLARSLCLRCCHSSLLRMLGPASIRRGNI